MSRKTSDVGEIDKLAPRERSYVKHRVSGKTKKAAALAAGYTLSMAENAAARIEKPNVRLAFQEKVRAKIPDDKIIERLAEGLDADKVEIVGGKGEDGLATPGCPDFKERREYVKLAAAMGGYFVDKQILELDDKRADTSDGRLAELFARAAARTHKPADTSGESGS